jgi:hypothetical protein
MYVYVWICRARKLKQQTINMAPVYPYTEEIIVKATRLARYAAAIHGCVPGLTYTGTDGVNRWAPTTTQMPVSCSAAFGGYCIIKNRLQIDRLVPIPVPSKPVWITDTAGPQLSQNSTKQQLTSNTASSNARPEQLVILQTKTAVKQQLQPGHALTAAAAAAFLCMLLQDASVGWPRWCTCMGWSGH